MSEECKVDVEDWLGDRVSPLCRVEDDRIQVFVFVRADCPISNRYAPELARLEQTFGDRVSFRLVYPDPEASLESILAHRSEFELWIHAFRDPYHSLVEHAEVSITPEVAVYRGTKRIYKGRIDDRWVAFGKERAAPTSEDLRQVLRDLVDGRRVTPYETEAVGCHIQDLAR